MGRMRKNPQPCVAKGIVTREPGARPKPHEYFAAEALADAGYNVCFIPSNVNMGMADCYINDTVFEIKAPEGKTVNCIERNIQRILFVTRKREVVDIK